MKILSIKSRKHMVDDRDNAENTCMTKNLILFICPTPEKNVGPNIKYRATEFTRLGLVVTKKIHKKAVIRNKFRRRLKEAFNLVDKTLLKNKYDYEILARQAIFTASLKTLIIDLEKCLKGEAVNNVPKLDYSNKKRKNSTKNNLTKTSDVLNSKLE